jgi:hypothetical protein
MPLLDQAAKLATRKLPKVISPKTHSMIDYAIAGCFFGMAAFFWRRNKRAAVSAIACGAAETALALSTDYSGGAAKRLSFETHNNIDFAMSGIVSSLPSVLHFADEPEAHYFRASGLAIAAVAGLTDFSGDGISKLDETLDRRSA